MNEKRIQHALHKSTTNASGAMKMRAVNHTRGVCGRTVIEHTNKERKETICYITRVKRSKSFPNFGYVVHF